jgi:hypothetical protein
VVERPGVSLTLKDGVATAALRRARRVARTVLVEAARHER